MPTEKERLYVEKIGLYFEQLTLPRMAGRIFGWLLISNSPQVTMGDLGEALKASKSSMSTMLRLLIQIGLVEMVSLPGERRDYYRICSDAWVNALNDRLNQARAFRQLADQGLDLLSASSLERRERLEEMQSMYAFLEREFPLLTQRWLQEGKKP